MGRTLRLVPVLPTEADHLRRQRRQSWWLLVARLASGRTQADAAAALNLTAPSYGDYERGITAPSLRQLAILATLYEVPLSLFTEPPLTDEERIEELAGWSSRRTQLAAAEAPKARARRRRSA